MANKATVARAFGAGQEYMQYHIFSPYRICPVGAHVDHQHGLVTGFALDKGVDFWFDITDDGSVELDSRTFEGHVSFNLKEQTLIKQGNWGDYARGAKYALRKEFSLKRGIKGVIQGSLPVGGLSSSAAVLIAYVMAFAKANDIELTPFKVAQLASVAEREYIGLNNGLLDQACIALGRQNQLLMLDCDTNDYRLIPFGGQSAASPVPAVPATVAGGSAAGQEFPFKLAIFFSGLTRSLMNSDYNLRVQECKTAVWDILAYDDTPIRPFDKTFLRDVPKQKYLKYKDQLPARFARRCEHFYSEYKRVRQAVTAWETGDLDWFGRLSFESCESSIHNYECGSPELISIYNAMRQTDGIYGGRFSGAGFKGACIALIDPAKADDIVQSVTDRYLHDFPAYKRTFKAYICNSADGARFV